jgi:acetyltransferase-like isoleucine patch superfamily enzyme
MRPISSGVTIEDGAFVGPHVCFTNDHYPRSTGGAGELLDADQWEEVPTRVGRGASTGANATVVCGVTIGEGALVGAGSVVIRDVPAGGTGGFAEREGSWLLWGGTRRSCVCC